MKKKRRWRKERKPGELFGSSRKQDIRATGSRGGDCHRHNTESLPSLPHSLPHSPHSEPRPRLGMEAHRIRLRCNQQDGKAWVPSERNWALQSFLSVPTEKGLRREKRLQGLMDEPRHPQGLLYFLEERKIPRQSAQPLKGSSL